VSTLFELKSGGRAPLPGGLNQTAKPRGPIHRNQFARTIEPSGGPQSWPRPVGGSSGDFSSEKKIDFVHQDDARHPGWRPSLNT